MAFKHISIKNFITRWQCGGWKPGDRPISGAGGPAINISVPISAQTLLSPSPAQGCVPSNHTGWPGTLAFESLWWVMGSQGDSLAQVGMDFPSPPGAYLGGWGIRESLPEVDRPKAQGTRLRFQRTALHPPPPPWASGSSPGGAAQLRFQLPGLSSRAPPEPTCLHSN